MATFIQKSNFPVSVEKLFRWHCQPQAFERLSPPFEKTQIIRREGGIEDGGTVTLQIKVGPFHLKWSAQHHDFIDNKQFMDKQVSGPFARFVHTHCFERESDGSSFLTDHIDYELPLGTIGRFLGKQFVKRKLQRLFTWRHERTRRDLLRHEQFSHKGPLRIAITGGSGLIGSALSQFLTTGGHEVYHLVRGQILGPNQILWNPEHQQVDKGALEGFDAIVHLAGESLSAHRWSPSQKERIHQSRVLGTQTLCHAIQQLRKPPRVFISGSATGIYGNQNSNADISDESAPLGDDFLAQVCKDWEQAAMPIEQCGVRLVRLRTGIVLSGKGGALASMLPIFRMGLGGKMGSGKQGFPFIGLDDIVYAIHFAIMNDALSGPVNAVHPASLSQAELAKTLGHVLQRPTILKTPAFALRILFGEMADAALLSGQRIQPAALLQAGFQFEDSTLEQALRFELGKLIHLKKT